MGTARDFIYGCDFSAILEPVRMEVTTPVDFMGDIISDLNLRRRPHRQGQNVAYAEPLENLRILTVECLVGKWLQPNRLARCKAADSRGF